MLHTWARSAAAIIAGISSSATASERGRAENATNSSTASSPAASPRAWIFGANLRSVLMDSRFRPTADARRLFPTPVWVRYNLLERAGPGDARETHRDSRSAGGRALRPRSRAGHLSLHPRHRRHPAQAHAHGGLRAVPGRRVGPLP